MHVLSHLSTPYFGVMKLLQPKEGETLLVNGQLVLLELLWGRLQRSMDAES